MTASPASFEVWPENAEPLNIFTAMATQWRINEGVVLGLDYQALSSVMEMMGVEDKPRTFTDVRLMERAVLKELKQ